MVIFFYRRISDAKSCSTELSMIYRRNRGCNPNKIIFCYQNSAVKVPVTSRSYIRANIILDSRKARKQLLLLLLDWLYVFVRVRYALADFIGILGIFLTNVTWHFMRKFMHLVTWHVMQHIFALKNKKNFSTNEEFLEFMLFIHFLFFAQDAIKLLRHHEPNEHHEPNWKNWAKLFSAKFVNSINRHKSHHSAIL